MANGWGGKRANSGPRKKNGSASKLAAQPKSKALVPVGAPMFTTEAVERILAAVREKQIASRNKPRTDEWNPYKIRPELFGPVATHIAEKRKQLAMDSNGGLMSANGIAVQAWQAGGLLSNAASEGLLFLGYPYLAELAQRPEFRLFGEIRAQEKTRRGWEFRGTEDESTKEENKPKANNPDDKEREAERRRNGEKSRSDTRNKEIERKIKELKDFEEELRVPAWFQASAAQDSFFGISHLFLETEGVDVNNLQDPELKTDIGNGRNKITEAKLNGKTGFLKGLRTIESIWTYPTTYNAINPLLPSWYDPQVWYVMGTEIHKSRLLTFIGRPVPDILKPAYAFGGLSMTQMAQPYVDIWLRTRESVGEIIHAFSVMVLKTNLATTTQPGGSGGGGGDVLARLALFLLLRDNQGVFAIDKQTEDFSNVAAPISGLDELQAQAQEHLCSVARIPLVKYTGIQPKGLNATSEGEMRAFNDTIHGEQEHLFRPNLTTVHDLMQISLWGERDPDITCDFLPLQELTPKEKAEVAKLDAETDQIRIDSGVVSQEEVRAKVAADPESGFSGLDPEDVPDLLEEEEAGLIPEGGGKGVEAELAQAKGKPNGKGNGKGTDGAADAAGMREILLIRHGATSLNDESASVDRIRGWTDVPLSEEGRREAKRLGEKLKADPPDVIVTSDLKRAAETAIVVSEITGTEVALVTQSFRPWDVGRYAGWLSTKAVPILSEWAAERPDQPVDGGEAFDTFRTRFFSGLFGVLDRFDGLVAVVTHHRDERLLKAWLAAGAPEDGDIDLRVFNQKGERTGHAETLSIPLRRPQFAEDGGIQNFDDDSEVLAMGKNPDKQPLRGDQGANLEEREGSPSGFDDAPSEEEARRQAIITGGGET